MIRVKDIAYVRAAAPDLDSQERFLTDFGMITVKRTEDMLYMRGYGTQPVIHITHRAHEGFVPGIGLIAGSQEDLETAAGELDRPIEDNDEPGGGRVVRATDPAGYHVELVFRPPVEALATRMPLPVNVGSDRGRFARSNSKVRFDSGPSHVLRLGHVVMKTATCDETFAWYRDHFNFRISDSVHVPGQPERNAMIFANCGLGDSYRDHHTLAFLGVPVMGFDHSAFEVIDWDDVMLGSAHLKKGGHLHSLGVGRHIGGSMVFDYWRDSGNNKIEHWTDGDLFNAEDPPRVASVEELMGVQWGANMPPAMLGGPEAEA